MFDLTMLDVAYLDAGTGSLIFQWLIAGALGIAFAGKMMWGRIAGLFGKKTADE